ncbi:class I SAM-dependent methyltransferase [Plantactinospora solaniradicis]|uniref:Class I SAM-dependent methyltransferase n=1 Tax=Plantactinospora solaniradicis TaxID=1723736 RepID=A0ABW1K919_9ACTN
MSDDRTGTSRMSDDSTTPSQDELDEAARYSLAWLGLREPADAQARATELLEPLRRQLAGTSRPVIHDLGCGSGSMGRWLAPRLPGPQHWIMYDHDPDLLAHAAANMVGSAADGSPVTVETRRADITRLTADDLAGATLVTASALLDLLTLEEVAGLAAACVGAGSAALLTLSVLGRVELAPADPADAEIAAAFDAHQRRNNGGRRLLGPDAVDAMTQAFGRLGVQVQVRTSPWRLGRDQAALTAQWLRGWVGAAYEQRPELADDGYLSRRLAAAEAGELRVVVHHADLFARLE